MYSKDGQVEKSMGSFIKFGHLFENFMEFVTMYINKTGDLSFQTM